MRLVLGDLWGGKLFSYEENIGKTVRSNELILLYFVVLDQEILNMNGVHTYKERKQPSQMKRNEWIHFCPFAANMGQHKINIRMGVCTYVNIYYFLARSRATLCTFAFVKMNWL